MARFKHYDHKQSKMLPIDFSEQIIPGSFGRLSFGRLSAVQPGGSEFNNSKKIDQKGNCYGLVEEEVKIILIINSKGMVERVIARENNAKSKCFVSTYMGVNFPKPPLAPYYVRMTMQ